MFNVIVALPYGQWQFLFDNREATSNIFKLYADGCKERILISDSFGTEALVDFSAVSGILVEDMSKAQDASIERSLNQTKAQVKFQNKAKNDPLLKFSLNQPMPGMNGPMPRIS